MDFYNKYKGRGAADMERPFVGCDVKREATARGGTDSKRGCGANLPRVSVLETEV
ncbi:hypothetical protein V6Z11_A07G120700 [Gossypium hirsutum]